MSRTKHILSQLAQAILILLSSLPTKKSLRNFIIFLVILKKKEKIKEEIKEQFKRQTLVAKDMMLCFQGDN